MINQKTFLPANPQISKILQKISIIKQNKLDVRNLHQLRSLFNELVVQLKLCEGKQAKDFFDRHDCILNLTGLYEKYNINLPELCRKCRDVSLNHEVCEEIDGVFYPYYYSWNW
ncbi:hypothetical protein ACFL5P_00955 [candidate division KSB1 bacterium]